MRVFKGICTDYVSDIDQLFHAPERQSAKESLARELEQSNAKRISRLRDNTVATDTSDAPPRLWEGF